MSAKKWDLMKARILKQIETLDSATQWQSTEPAWWLEL
jgi:hypothetical protein